MKTAIKFTALAVAMALIVISCAVEAELTERDWGAKTADLDATKLDISNNTNAYRPSVQGGYDSRTGEVKIYFPDAADVLRADNAALEGKLKEFMKVYTYSSRVSSYAADQLGSEVTYEVVKDNGFVKRLPASNGEIITIKLNSYSHFVIKIDADKYTFASGKKLGGADDIIPGSPYYDVYLSVSVSGGGSFDPFVNNYQWNNTLSIGLQEISADTNFSSTRARVADLTLSSAASGRLQSYEQDTLQQTLLGSLVNKLKLQKYGNNGWEDVAGSFSYDYPTRTVTVSFLHDDLTPYRVEANGVNDLTVNYFGNSQPVQVRGWGGNMSKGYNRGTVVSNVYTWQNPNRNYVNGSTSIIYGSEWVSTDRDGKNAVIRLWFKAQGVSNNNYYPLPMDLADFNRNAKIVFSENGTAPINADDLCYIDVKDIIYSNSFSSGGQDTLTIILDPNVSVKEFTPNTVYLLLSPGFKYASDDIVFGNVGNWNYEIGGVKYFDAYQLPVGSGSAPLPAPTGLNASAQSTTSIYLNWNTVNNASSYILKRSFSSSGNYTQVGSPYGTSYTDNNLSPGITYYYKVAAVDSSGGEGAESSPIPATTYTANNPGQVIGMPTLNVTGTTTTSISLSWSAGENAVRYHIYRGMSSSSLQPISLDSYGTSYTDSSLLQGTTYYYRVDPVGSNGYIGNQSNIVSATTQGGSQPSGPLSAPTGLNASAQSSTSIYLSWNPVSNATYYYIYRGATPGSLTYLDYSNSTNFYDDYLSEDTTYYYEVTAYNYNSTPSESGRSNTASARTGQGNQVQWPPNSTPLSVDQWVSDTITSSTVGGEKWYSFYVYSGTTYYLWWNDSNEGDWTKTLNIEVDLYHSNGDYVDTNSGEFSGRNNGWNTGNDFYATVTETVYVKVDSYYGGGYGSYAIAYSTTNTRPTGSDPGPVLSAPTGLTVTGTTSSSVSLQWNSVSNASYYNIWRRTSSGTYSNVDYSSTTTYTDTGLNEGVTYYYYVTAYNSSFSPSESDSSGYVSATPQGGAAPGLSAPTGVFATATSSSSITISWNVVSAADGYAIWRSSTASGYYTNVDYTSSTSYTDTGLSANTTYYYQVTANDNNYNQSSQSDTTYATTWSGGTPSVTPLTSGVWVNDSITTAYGEKWYTFTVYAGTTYYLWWDDGYTSGNGGTGTKTLDIEVLARYNSTTGTMIFDDGDSAYNTAKSFYANTGGTAYVRVRAYNGGSSTGTYAIVYSTNNSRPPAGSVPVEPSITPLYEGEWVDSSFTSSDQEAWYTFDVTYGQTYYIWWNDSNEGDGTKTADVMVSALYNSTSGSNAFYSTDSAYDYATSFIANINGTVYVRVTPYSWSDGTYGIVYSTNNSNPSIESWAERITIVRTSAPVYGFNLPSNRSFGDYDRIVFKLQMDYISPMTNARLRAWGNYDLSAWTDVDSRPNMRNETPGGLLLNTAGYVSYEGTKDGWMEYELEFTNRDNLSAADAIKSANGIVAVAFGLIANNDGTQGTRIYYVKDIMLSNATRTETVPALRPDANSLWYGYGESAYVTQDAAGGDLTYRDLR